MNFKKVRERLLSRLMLRIQKKNQRLNRNQSHYLTTMSGRKTVIQVLGVDVQEADLEVDHHQALRLQAPKVKLNIDLTIKVSIDSSQLQNQRKSMRQATTIGWKCEGKLASFDYSNQNSFAS